MLVLSFKSKNHRKSQSKTLNTNPFYRLMKRFFGSNSHMGKFMPLNKKCQSRNSTINSDHGSVISLSTVLFQTPYCALVVKQDNKKKSIKILIFKKKRKILNIVIKVYASFLIYWLKSLFLFTRRFHVDKGFRLYSFTRSY